MVVRAIVGAMAVGLVGLSAHSPAKAQDIDVAAEIEKVRQATQKYEDLSVALAEGYIVAPPGDCVTAAHEGLPAEWGGMGVHYIHPAKLKITGAEPRVNGGSTHTDFMAPAILLYEPQEDGTMKLVGVENLVFLAAWKGAGNAAPPSFAGRSYDTMADVLGTSSDEAHGFEPHHDQHIYFTDSDSPMDQLKPFHSSVTCEHAKSSGAH